MRVFLSYASEDLATAERLALALSAEGYTVFFDRASLSPGDAYNREIRKAIERADLFIYLASRTSTKDGSYALSELRLGREAAETSRLQILPIAVGNVDVDALPPIVRDMSILFPVGDLVAEATAAAARAARRSGTAEEKLGAFVAGSVVPMALAFVLRVIWHPSSHDRAPTRIAAALLALVGYGLFEAMDKKPNWFRRLGLSGLLVALTHAQLQVLYEGEGERIWTGTLTEAAMLAASAGLTAIAARPLLVRWALQARRRIRRGRVATTLLSPPAALVRDRSSASPERDDKPGASAQASPLAALLGVSRGPVEWGRSAVFAASILAMRVAITASSLLGTREWNDWYLLWSYDATSRPGKWLALRSMWLLEPVCILVFFRVIERPWLATVVSAGAFGATATIVRLAFEPNLLSYLEPSTWLLDFIVFPVLVLGCLSTSVGRVAVLWKAIALGYAGAMFLRLTIAGELMAGYDDPFPPGRTLAAVGVSLLAALVCAGIVCTPSRASSSSPAMRDLGPSANRSS